jgi:hypothetical protein
MAIEFILTLAARREASEVLGFVAAELPDGKAESTGARGDGLWVEVWPLSDEEKADWPEVLGVQASTEVRLRLVSGAAYEAFDAARAAAVRLALRCLDRFGDGLLLYNGDQIVLVRLAGETTLNVSWHWKENPALADVVASFPSAELSDPNL